MHHNKNESDVQRNCETQTGFTITEVLIVLIAIGTLAAIAIPGYQDYTLRSQVTEGLNLASWMKVAVADAYARNSAWPRELDGSSRAPSGKYVEHLFVHRGTIFIEYGGARLAGQRLSLRPTMSPTGDILWSCGYSKDQGFDPPSGPAAPHDTNINSKNLPASCRR